MSYIIPLTEQEELNLRQLTMHPGYPALLKLAHSESFSAQAEAMACKGTSEQRLLALSDAQAMAAAVSRLTQKLEGYRTLPESKENPADPLRELGELYGR